MNRQRWMQTRRGVTTVEVALVAPLTFLLLIGLVVGGFGIFRYQQVAALAREGARWASVRGPQYQRRNRQPAPTSADVFNNAIRPKAVSLNPQQLTYAVEWDADATTVAVTVNYDWVPERYLFPVKFTSRSAMPITY